MELIVIWGAIAIVSCVAAGVLASYKRRDFSAWVAWGFIFPPSVIVLAILSKHEGPIVRRPSLDEDDYARD
ncbi:MAG: hypothetical protein AAFR04_00555 [Pseudomonadota bacterium]